jgi:hypothetical protein
MIKLGIKNIINKLIAKLGTKERKVKSFEMALNVAAAFLFFTNEVELKILVVCN